MTRGLAASSGVRPKNAGEQDVRSPMWHGLEALTAEDWKFLTVAEGEPITRFEAYLRQHEIKPAHLAQRSGYTRQHLHRLRQGTQEPTRRCITAILAALQSLTGDRVEARHLFDLGKR